MVPSDDHQLLLVVVYGLMFYCMFYLNLYDVQDMKVPVYALQTHRIIIHVYILSMGLVMLLALEVSILTNYASL